MVGDLGTEIAKEKAVVDAAKAFYTADDAAKDTAETNLKNAVTTKLIADINTKLKDKSEPTAVAAIVKTTIKITITKDTNEVTIKIEKPTGGDAFCNELVNPHKCNIE